MTDCPLCAADGGILLWRDDTLRVIDAAADGYPGFTRVVWQAHVREMTDLSAPQRQRLMDVVWTVERVQRDLLSPDKINLASLGNMAPHLHWHIIPRWRDDSHFPEAVWAPVPVGKNLQQARTRAQQVADRLADYHAALRIALQDLSA